MLSAVVFIFWPEEKDLIDTCLKSLNFADEIIVIDNGAPKEVVEIAKKYTPKIYQNDSKSFAQRHNFAKEQCKGDWILYLDADERVSASLVKRIKEKLMTPDGSAYMINRVNFFLGKKVRYGDRYPDYVTRLFKKEDLKNWSGDIHESSNVDGAIVKINEPIYHLTHRDIFSMMEKTIVFSETEAQIRFKNKHPEIVGWRLVRVFATEFVTRIFKYQGWRQGTQGWIDGIFQAFSLFIVYARLWELQQKQSLPDTYQEIDKKILDGQEL